MLRYICVLSLSMFKLWGAALPTETPAAPPQPQQQHKELIPEGAFTRYCVVTTDRGCLRFRNEPYGAPLRISSLSIQEAVCHLLQNTPVESAHTLLTKATTALNLRQISQEHYAEIVSKYFDFLMDHFQKKYTDFRLARANLALFSNYRHVCQNAEQARILPMFTAEQQHRLTCCERSTGQAPWYLC